VVQKNGQGGTKNGRASTNFVRPAGSKSVQTINTNNKELEINNKYIEDIYQYFLSKINSGAGLTDNARKVIAERLKIYSVEQLKQAIDGFASSGWKMQRNSHRGIAWFFRSDDKIEEYMLTGFEEED